MRWLAVIVLLAACGDRTPAAMPPTVEESSPPPFRFRWDPPCRVPVTERADIGGGQNTFLTTVEVTRIGDRLRVALLDLRFLEIKGVDVRDPASQAKLAPAMRAMESGLSNVLVTTDGTFDRIEDYDAMVETIADLGAGSPEVIEVMRTPEMRAMSEHLISAYWNAWVGAWVGWTLQPGATEKSATRVREYLSLADGVARLRMTETLDGDAFSRQNRDLLLAVQPGLDPAIEVEGSMVETFEAEIDPTTLRPVHTHYEMHKNYTVAGTPVTQSTMRDDTFDWEHAEGCGE